MKKREVRAPPADSLVQMEGQEEPIQENGDSLPHRLKGEFEHLKGKAGAKVKDGKDAANTIIRKARAKGKAVKAAAKQILHPHKQNIS